MKARREKIYITGEEKEGGKNQYEALKFTEQVSERTHLHQERPVKGGVCVSWLSVPLYDLTAVKVRIKGRWRETLSYNHSL